MCRKIIAYFLLAMIIVVMASCKTKQSVSKSVTKDSTEQIKVVEDKNQKIHLVVKYSRENNGQQLDSAMSNLLLLPLTDDVDSKNSWSLPYIPGMEIDYQFDLVQNKKTDRKTNVVNKTKDKEKIPQQNKTSCHFVIWMLIFAVFLCLVVRYRKIIAKMFGALRKKLYLRSVKGD